MSNTFPRIRFTDPDLKEMLFAWRFINPVTGCWEWMGNRIHGGYGISMAIEGVGRSVHRVSGFLFRGWPLEDSNPVCHTCDNPPCFNPDHLFKGTHGDNVRDAVAKGKHYKGHIPRCPSGHTIAGSNVRIVGQGHKHCKLCYSHYEKERNRLRKAVSKRKICRSGHELTENNIYRHRNYAGCRICRAEHDKKRQQRRKAQHGKVGTT